MWITAKTEDENNSSVSDTAEMMFSHSFVGLIKKPSSSDRSLFRGGCEASLKPRICSIPLPVGSSLVEENT